MKKTASKPPSATQVARQSASDRVSSYLAASSTRGFEQSQALVPFFEKLARLANRETPSSLHILHFGDSHTAADQWTGVLRFFFQNRFGNGGSGYSLAGDPFAGYRRIGTRHGATPGWRTLGLSASEGDGYVGLGGISVSTSSAGQSVFIEADCSLVTVYYLQMPGGGDLELLDNDRLVKRFSTDGTKKATMLSYRTSPGLHSLRVLTLQDKPVRLLGWSTDRDSGITYESLGINGAQASIFFNWQDAMLARYLRYRDPSLIVLAYGTNEAGDPNVNSISYEERFSALLRRLRFYCPTASILVLGPTDRMIRSATGITVAPGIDRVIAAQRVACAENRCAYWNAKSRMGGSGSIREWVLAGMAQEDYVHFTPAGYDKLAEVLYTDTMRLYQFYLSVRGSYLSQNRH